MTFTLPYQDKVIEFQFSPIFSINVREHASYVHTTIFVLSDEQQYLYGEPKKIGIKCIAKFENCDGKYPQNEQI